MAIYSGFSLDFPIKNGDFNIVMLVYQRVVLNILNIQVEPPGLEPELSDTSLWRHLLRGAHGFSLQGPGASPVSLFPEAPEVARTGTEERMKIAWMFI